MISVAVVGTGDISPSPLRAYRALGSPCRVVALCDIVPRKAEALRRELGLDEVADRRRPRRARRRPPAGDRRARRAPHDRAHHRDLREGAPRFLAKSASVADLAGPSSVSGSPAPDTQQPPHREGSR